MSQPFKFRFVNEIAGIFVLLAVLILVVGIFLVGQAQGLFEPKFKVNVILTSEEGAFGLKKGAEVRIKTAPAGSVKRVEPTTNGAILATFELKETFHYFVRTNSQAVVKKTMIIAGDSYVEIRTRFDGSNAVALVADGGTIECVKDTEITEKAMKVLDDISGATVPAFRKVEAAVDTIPGLVAQIGKTLREGENVLRDDVPGVTVQAQDTLREVQVLIQGIQRHWMFRKYIDPYTGSPMIAPSGIGAPAPGVGPDVPGTPAGVGNLGGGEKP